MTELFFGDFSWRHSHSSQALSWRREKILIKKILWMWKGILKGSSLHLKSCKLSWKTLHRFLWRRDFYFETNSKERRKNPFKPNHFNSFLSLLQFIPAWSACLLFSTFFQFCANYKMVKMIKAALCCQWGFLSKIADEMKADNIFSFPLLI